MKKSNSRTSKNVSTQQTLPAASPQTFGYDEMLSELEAIVADAERRLVEEEETA
nr:hypothetical protein [Phytobacter massiliensis]